MKSICNFGWTTVPQFDQVGLLSRSSENMGAMTISPMASFSVSLHKAGGPGSLERYLQALQEDTTSGSPEGVE